MEITYVTLAPFLNAPLEIQIHAFAALCALCLGPIVLYLRVEQRVHKVLGYVWITSMVTTALSSFMIHSFSLIGPFSPIHLLSCYVLWSMWIAVQQARRGAWKAHAETMQSLYWYGLCIAGLLTLLPGRVLSRSLFGSQETTGIWIAAIGLACLAMRAIWRRNLGLKTESGKKLRFFT